MKYRNRENKEDQMIFYINNGDKDFSEEIKLFKILMILQPSWLLNPNKSWPSNNKINKVYMINIRVNIQPRKNIYLDDPSNTINFNKLRINKMFYTRIILYWRRITINLLIISTITKCKTNRILNNNSIRLNNKIKGIMVISVQKLIN